MLTLLGISVETSGKRVVSDASFDVGAGELCVLMGPNGSGKSSLAMALAGHPHYKITKGEASIEGENILSKTPDERNRAGLFISFQRPPAIPGVPGEALMRAALQARSERKIAPREARQKIVSAAKRLGLMEETVERELFVGFSGGEAKRMEMAQLLALGAKIAVLDEPDSGLDIDGIRTIAREIHGLLEEGTGVLLITHNPRIISFLAPKKILVMSRGRIAARGGIEIIAHLEAHGFNAWNNLS